MFPLGKRARVFKHFADSTRATVIKPLDFPRVTEGKDYNYLSIPLVDMPELASKYVVAMETSKSEDWCRCEWLIHPDDTAIGRGRCRHCGEKRDTGIHEPTGVVNGWWPEVYHAYQGIRMRKGDQAWDCPVHTREGFLLYFFEWIKRND